MERRIPKVIHYCWFGGNPLPEQARKCIASWKTYLPDFEIKEWNESNFDVYSIPYTAEAYALKQYAFVSDYARFLVLYHYGGVYFDTDVEVLRPLDDIIAKGSFMGFEYQDEAHPDNPHGSVAVGLGMGVWKNHPFFGKMVSDYEREHFVKRNGKAASKHIVYRVSHALDFDHKEDLPGGIIRVNDLLVYPVDYFCPINHLTGETHYTENTRSVHYYDGSWNRKRSFLSLVRFRIRRILVRMWSDVRFSFLKYNRPDNARNPGIKELQK